MEAVSLSLLVFFPLFAGLFLLSPLFPNNEVKIRRFAKGVSALLFAYSLYIFCFFNHDYAGYQFVDRITLPGGVDWLKPLGIEFVLGLDGISMVMVLLTTFLGLLSFIASKSNITKKHKLYYGLLLILISAVLGVFSAKDLFVFFLFWELELIPMYLLILLWGSGRKEYSALKFVLYTFFGSIFMLAAILAMVYYYHQSFNVLSFDIEVLSSVSNYYPLLAGIPIFLGFFTAFAVKLPVVPVHTWLPDAHVDAPTPVSMLLAGILLKMGAYGLVRFNLQAMPEIFKLMSPFIVLLGVINILYAAMIALAQKDLKKLVAYSSISHMGIVLVGLGAMNVAGVSGAIFQMVAHGIISAGLFMMVGSVYLRTHTRGIFELGGLGQVMPRINQFSLLLALASLGLPLLAGFSAETLVFYGAFTSKAFSGILNIPVSIQHLAVLAIFGIVLTAVYLLWMLQHVFCGVMFETRKKISDATPHELVIFMSLAFAIILFGIYPTALTDIFNSSVVQILYNI